MEFALIIGIILASISIGYVICKIRDSSSCSGTLHIVRDENESNRVNLYLELKENPRVLEKREFVILRVKRRK